MNKMIFIEPKASTLHIFSRFKLPRLGCFILGTLLRDHGWEVEVLIEENQPLDYKKIYTADLVGISTITPTAPRAYAIADTIRVKGIPVIMGGPHVTFLPEEALEHADFVIRGEAEKAFMEFIIAWEDDKQFAAVPNLSYKDRGRSIHNSMADFENNLDSIPFPDFSLFKGNQCQIGGKTLIPLQASRGCPFDCSFCSVTGMFGKKYRFRSTDNIIQELRQYNHSDNFVFFYDDNFTANRKRAKALLRAMINENFSFPWSTQVRTDIAKDIELVKLVQKAGCHTLFIGFESINPDILDTIKKRQTVDDILLATKILRQHNIHIHGMFVHGFDQDNWETVKANVNFAIRAYLTSAQFLILTPYPGSEFYQKIKDENRIKFDDWALYDAHHIVFQPIQFSLLDAQKGQIFSHEKFYSLRQMIKKLIRKNWVGFGLTAYARKLDKDWKKENVSFLKTIDLSSQEKQDISSSRQQNTNL